MGRLWRVGACSMVVLTAACGAGRSVTATTVPSRTTTIPSTAPATSVPSTTTTTTEPLTVTVTVSPDHVFVGTALTFTVEIRGAGTLDSEDVHFGDGGTQGANAGMITCGDTSRADRTGTYTHSYATPGTYQFTDEVQVLGPRPPAHARL